MRKYSISGKSHYVYDDIDEVPDNISVKKDWRNASKGDWILADDGSIIQIIRKGKLRKDNYYIGTCTGTFTTKSKYIDTDRRKNIYSLGGNMVHRERTRQDKNATTYEILFAQHLSKGCPLVDAYIKAYPTNNRTYALSRAKSLIRTERIQRVMKNELREVLEAEGVHETYVIRRLKCFSDNATKEDNQLRALLKLSDILDLEEKNTTTTTQISGYQFHGLENNDIKEILEPKKEIK